MVDPEVVEDLILLDVVVQVILRLQVLFKDMMAVMEHTVLDMVQVLVAVEQLLLVKMDKHHQVVETEVQEHQTIFMVDMQLDMQVVEAVHLKLQVEEPLLADQVEEVEKVDQQELFVDLELLELLTEVVAVADQMFVVHHQELVDLELL
tara:strand:- start:956 stop:1402 length:447 start_codon:yes stop_codon:yes gene_type:complete